MKVLPRSIYAQFCESVRDEKSGKTTIVGIFARIVNVPKFPQTFDTLTVYLNGTYDIKDPIRSFILKVYRGDELLIEHPTPEGFFERSLKRAREQGRPVGGINTSLKIVGLEIEEESELKAVADIDGEEFLIGALTVRVKNDAEDPS